MKILLPLLPISLFLIFQSSPLLAVSIHKCEDEQGEVTYQERCPPGTQSMDEKHYRVKGDDNGDNTATDPLTLYVATECESCQLVQEFLALRDIPVNRKNVDGDQELQDELREVTGELRVPVLLVNDTILKGFNRSELIGALSKAGYRTETPVDE